MKVAVIPARGGSKRIPRKNIKYFCGKPMMAWSIQAALECGLFDHVIVSTDDAEIADVAKAHGAEVPFLRPAYLSGDHVATRPVINHAIDEAELRWGPVDYVCCIYATAPFLEPEDIRNGFNMLAQSDAQFSFSVATFPYPIQRALRVTKDWRVEMLWPEQRMTRSQDLEETYHDAGQFYWGRTSAFKQDLPTFSSHSIPVVLPRRKVQDIDTPEDWDVAELMFKAGAQGRS